MNTEYQTVVAHCDGVQTDVAVQWVHEITDLHVVAYDGATAESNTASVLVGQGKIVAVSPGLYRFGNIFGDGVGYFVYITRKSPVTVEAARVGTTLPLDAILSELAELKRRSEEAQEETGKSLLTPERASEMHIPRQEHRAGKILGFDPDGKPAVGADVPEIAELYSARDTALAKAQEAAVHAQEAAESASDAQTQAESATFSASNAELSATRAQEAAVHAQEAAEAIPEQIEEHDADPNAHSPIRNNFIERITEHNESPQAHADIRNDIEAIAVDALNLKDFGAKGDGATDDSAALANAVAQAIAQDKPLFIPQGDYILSNVPKEGITTYKWDVNRTPRRYSIEVYGDGPGTRLVWTPSEECAVLFCHADFANFHDFTVLDQNHWQNMNYTREHFPVLSYRGIVFSTPVRTQSQFGVYERIKSYGNFRYFYYARFSLFDSFKDIRSEGACVHFCFARGDGGVTKNAEDWTWADRCIAWKDPKTASTDGWNGGVAGWFHNSITMSNISMIYGEVGIYGSAMNLHGSAIDCERMVNPSTNTTNKSVFLGNYQTPGTGVWLVGKNGEILKGNVISSFYCEVVEQAFHIEFSGMFRVLSAFAQGAWSSSTAGSIGALFWSHVSGGAFGLCGVFDTYKARIRIDSLHTSGTFSRPGRVRGGSNVQLCDLSNTSGLYTDGAEPLIGATGNVYTTGDFAGGLVKMWRDGVLSASYTFGSGNNTDVALKSDISQSATLQGAFDAQPVVDGYRSITNSANYEMLHTIAGEGTTLGLVQTDEANAFQSQRYNATTGLIEVSQAGISKDATGAWNPSLSVGKYNTAGTLQTSTSFGVRNGAFVCQTVDNTGASPAVSQAFPVLSGAALAIWRGTQAEYDAIAAKDTNTMYVIV